jgi:hypothetical protein
VAYPFTEDLTICDACGFRARRICAKWASDDEPIDPAADPSLAAHPAGPPEARAAFALDRPRLSHWLPGALPCRHQGRWQRLIPVIVGGAARNVIARQQPQRIEQKGRTMVSWLGCARSPRRWRCRDGREEQNARLPIDPRC